MVKDLASNDLRKSGKLIDSVGTYTEMASFGTTSVQSVTLTDELQLAKTNAVAITNVAKKECRRVELAFSKCNGSLILYVWFS